MSIITPQKGFPKHGREMREFVAMRGRCPDCGGDVTASPICADCGADHGSLLNGIPKFTPEHNELCSRLVSRK